MALIIGGIDLTPLGVLRAHQSGAPDEGAAPALGVAAAFVDGLAVVAPG